MWPQAGAYGLHMVRRSMLLAVLLPAIALVSTCAHRVKVYQVAFGRWRDESRRLLDK